MFCIEHNWMCEGLDCPQCDARRLVNQTLVPAVIIVAASLGFFLAVLITALACVR